MTMTFGSFIPGQTFIYGDHAEDDNWVERLRTREFSKPFTLAYDDDTVAALELGAGRIRYN